MPCRRSGASNAPWMHKLRRCRNTSGGLRPWRTPSARGHGGPRTLFVSTRSLPGGRSRTQGWPGGVDRVELKHAPKAIACLAGRNDGSDRKCGYRHRTRRRDTASHATLHRRELDWPPTGRHLPQRRRREHRHAHSLACVEAFLRLRSGDERHPRVCSRLCEWDRDPGPYHDHFVAPRIRALDEAPGDSARPKAHRPLPRNVLATGCAVAATRRLHQGRRHKRQTPAPHGLLHRRPLAQAGAGELRRTGAVVPTPSSQPSCS